MILSTLLHTLGAKVNKNLGNLRHPKSDMQQLKNTYTPKPTDFNDFVLLESKILIKMIKKTNEFHISNIKPSKHKRKSMVLWTLMHTFGAKVIKHIGNLRHPKSDMQQRKNTYTPKPKDFNDVLFLESNILIKMIEKPNECHSFNMKHSKTKGNQWFC